MKIIARKDDHNIRLRFPTGLLLNGCTAFIFYRKARKRGVQIRYSQIQTIVKTLNHYRRTHPDWVLAEIHGAGGEYVFVKL